MTKEESSSDRESRRFRRQPGGDGAGGLTNSADVPTVTGRRRKRDYDDQGPAEDKWVRARRDGARGQGDVSSGLSEPPVGGHGRRGRGACSHTEGRPRSPGREAASAHHANPALGTAVVLRGLAYEIHPDIAKDTIRSKLHGYTLIDIDIPWRLKGGCTGGVTVVFDTREAAIAGSRVLHRLEVGRRYLEVMRAPGWGHWSVRHLPAGKPMRALPAPPEAPPSPARDEGLGGNQETGDAEEQHGAAAAHGRVITVRGDAPWRPRRAQTKGEGRDDDKGAAPATQQARRGPARLENLSLAQLAASMYETSGRLRRTAAELMRRTRSGARTRRSVGRSGSPGSSGYSSAEDSPGKNGDRDAGP